jgi:large subunit ribosomal protein L1
MKETDPSQRKQRKFDETVEVALNTSVDPRRGDQMVRGMASLPHGTGKKVRVCVFTVQDVAQGAAQEAGADVIGDDALISKIQQDGSSAINFDACLATPDMMSKLGKIARILGPRGLMPNPKLGTVTQDVAAGVVAMKQGRVEFRADKGAIIHGGVGKKSFSVEALQENIEAFVRSVVEARPKAIKGQGIPGYILKMTLSTTMGPSVPVALSSLEK